MAIQINTNTASSFSTRVLGQNWAKTQQSEERLSTGSRINHGSDDAAGLSIGEHNRAHMRSLSQAARNLQDGNALLATADGALSQLGELVLRIRELAIQGASDTISDTERRMTGREVSQLVEEIARISSDTAFNGVKLLDGSARRIEIQADANNDASTSRIAFDSRNFDSTLERLRLGDISVATKEDSRECLAVLDYARERIYTSRASIGSLQHQLDTCRDNVLTRHLNLAASRSRITDTDYAEESSELVKNSIITQANTAMLTQANHSPEYTLKLLK